MKDDYYILANIDEMPSRINDSTIYTLTWLNADTLEQYQTIVDDSYDNYKRCGWIKIVHNPYYHGLYTNIKETKRTTKKGIPVLSADSKAHIEALMTPEQIVEYVEQRHQELKGIAL